MSRPTKKAKKVVVTEIPYTSSYSSYKCPACKTNCQDYGLRDSVTRMRCSCGQELILIRQQKP